MNAGTRPATTGLSRRARPAVRVALACLLLPCASHVAAEPDHTLPSAQPPGRPCADGSGPRAAVMGYLTAMHERRFADAWDFVSTGMTDGRDRDAWSALQAQAFDPARVQIYGVDLRAARALGDAADCAARAGVPNVMSSRDRLNEAGLVEFEIYVVVRDGDAWRVDLQETLYDDDAIAAWFPASRVVETTDAP